MILCKRMIYLLLQIYLQFALYFHFRQKYSQDYEIRRCFQVICMCDESTMRHEVALVDKQKQKKKKSIHEDCRDFVIPHSSESASQ